MKVIAKDTLETAKPMQLGSEEHKEYLVNLILKKTNSHIKKKTKLHGLRDALPLRVVIDNDLSHWPEADELLRARLKEGGWEVEIKWGAGQIAESVITLR